VLECAKSSILPNGNFQITVASLSAYCVRACKIKHFTELEFSGIYSLAGELCVFKTGIPEPGQQILAGISDTIHRIIPYRSVINFYLLSCIMHIVSEKH